MAQHEDVLGEATGLKLNCTSFGSRWVRVIMASPFHAT